MTRLQKLKNYIEGNDLIDFHDISVALSADSVIEMAAARELLVYHFSRIIPKPHLSEYAELLVRYYLACIENEGDVAEHQYVHSRFEAATELLRLFEHWISSNDQSIRRYALVIVNGVTHMFQLCGESTKNVIETGFLEHVFEIKENQELFSHWKESPFDKAYQDCRKWGDSHLRRAVESGDDPTSDFEGLPDV